MYYLYCHVLYESEFKEFQTLGDVSNYVNKVKEDHKKTVEKTGIPYDEPYFMLIEGREIKGVV